MANSEACGVWIDQRGDELIEEGKNPNEIGEELSKDIQKLFETTINPATIAQKIRRQQKKKNLTNVRKESKTKQLQVDSTKDIPKLVDSGGKRKGAGRPKKIVEEIEHPSCITTDQDFKTFKETKIKNLKKKAGRPRVESERDVPKKKLKVPTIQKKPKEIISEKFQEAYDKLMYVVKNERAEKWENTNQYDAANLINNLYELVIME